MTSKANLFENFIELNNVIN